MWEIWANWLLPKALKSCPKSNKLPNLVTLVDSTDKTLLQVWIFNYFKTLPKALLLHTASSYLPNVTPIKKQTGKP